MGHIAASDASERPPHVIGCQMAVRGSARRALFCLRRLPGAGLDAADTLMAAGAPPLVDPEQLVRSHIAPACNLVERVATKIAVTCSPGGMLVREIRG